MSVVSTDKASPPKGPYSQGRSGDGLLFTAGQGPFAVGTGDVTGETFQEQAQLTLENLRAVILAGGGKLSDTLKVNVYLVNMGDFAKLNGVYTQFFSDPLPARTTVCVAALPGGIQVEMEAIVKLY